MKYSLINILLIGLIFCKLYKTIMWGSHIFISRQFLILMGAMTDKVFYNRRMKQMVLFYNSSKMQLFLINFLIIFELFTFLISTEFFPLFSCLRSYILPEAPEKFLPSRYALRTPASSSSRLP